jgi:uncharacterized protein involved in exopolysaccharide biosynthesis
MSRRSTRRDFAYHEAELDPELVVGLEVPNQPRRRMTERLALLWQERQLLLRCAAVGVVLSAIVAFLIPLRYTSTTELMPPDQVGEGLASTLAALTKGGGSELGAIGSTLLGLRTSSDLFIGVLHSRSVEDDLINKFDLRKLYGVRKIEDARKVLNSRTDITSDRKSGIVSIKVIDRSPQRAAAMAQEYVDQLNRIVVSLNTSSAHKERAFLENRLGEVQQDLEAAEKDFSKFASQNTAIDVKEQGKALIGAAAELEGQLIAAQTQMEGLRQIYTDNNVRVRTLQARIAEYKRQLQKLDGNSPTATDETNSPNQTQDDQSQELYPSIRRLPILGVTYADLYRRTKVEEVVFETLTKQYEIAKVEEARETPSVKVLDVADVPEQKSFPPRMLLILFGTVLVLAAGCAWVLGRESWREVDPGDPRKVLVLDVMQTMQKKPWVSRSLQFVKNRSSNGFHSRNGRAPSQKEDPPDQGKE